MRPSLLQLEVVDRWAAVRAHPPVRRLRAILRVRGKVVLAVLIATGILAMVIHWS
jgi:hypothetical protein